MEPASGAKRRSRCIKRIPLAASNRSAVDVFRGISIVVSGKDVLVHIANIKLSATHPGKKEICAMRWEELTAPDFTRNTRTGVCLLSVLERHSTICR